MEELSQDANSRENPRQHYRCERGYPTLRWFDWLVFLVFLVLIASSDYWKDDGPTVLATVWCLLVIYVAHNAVSHRIVLRNGLLLTWSVVGIVHIGLSYARWLPGTPVIFYKEYILRTGYFALLAYPATAAFYVLFAKARSARALPIVAKLCVAAAVIAMLAQYRFPVYDGIWRVEGVGNGVFDVFMATLNYGIDNITIVFWWGILLLSGWRVRWMVGIVTVMALSDSGQMLLIALVTCGLWLWRRSERYAGLLAVLIVIGLPIVGVLLVTIGTGYSDTQIDANAMVRAHWWVDSLNAVIQNRGVGFGFGADSIVDPTFSDRFSMEGKYAKLPIIVLHNSFVYVFYAMGVIGGVLFLIFHFKDLLPRQGEERNMRRHAVLMFLMACLTLSVNVALESPNYALGVFWIYGYVLETNHRVQSAAGRARVCA